MSLSYTFSAISRKIGSAIGPVISFAITTSNFASISWPADTESSPAWAASIFCVIVIPIMTSSFILVSTLFLSAILSHNSLKEKQKVKESFLKYRNYVFIQSSFWPLQPILQTTAAARALPEESPGNPLSSRFFLY